MVQKYHRQIEPVTDWKAIAHQYYQTQNFEELKKKFEENERQIIVTRGQIAVSFPYDAELVRLVKSVEPRGKFNGEDKNWYFHHSACKSLQETFEDEGFCIDENLQALIELENAKEIEKEEEILRKAENTLNLLNSIDLDKPLSNGWSLFEHQKEGIKWLLSHNKEGLLRGGILADHMGLGKTIQTLIAAKELSARNANCPVLVVCPASLRENWAREASIIEVTIETFSWAKLPTPLENSKYILVADEAHYAQNLKSKRTQRLLELAESKNCLASWLLTGTPLKNGRPVNLFPLLLACNHHLSESKSQYEKYYCNAHNNGWGWDVSGASHLDELAKKTEDVILRRTKKECLDLPEKIRSYREVLLEGKEKKAYQAEIDEFINDYRRRVEAGEVDENAEALVTLNILRKVGSKYKVPATIEVAEELLEQNQQIVIFTEFREAAIQIAEQLKGELLLGDTKQEERQNIVDRFQSGESKVFVGSIKAGGVGITLTASSHVILHDRPWTPGDAEQAEDRCHRIGQGNTVNAYWQQLGIIDHSIDSLLTQKQQRIELVLKGKRKTLKGITSPKELAKQLLSIL
jgi:SNF2 family DNA or RNA helicase